MLEPPQIPGQRGVVAAIPRHEAPEAQYERPGQQQG